MEVWGLTDPGKVRKENQDSYEILRLGKDKALLVICDGMGGARAGNIASTLASGVFVKELQAGLKLRSDPERVSRAMVRAAEAANAAVFEKANSSEDYAGMGTTLVAAFVTGQWAAVVNVGDSRAYRMGRSGIRQITEDHSLVEDMVRRGELAPEDARRHPRKNLITRAIGTDGDVQCDVFLQQLERGDCILLCSDGLSNVVSDQEMLFEVLHGVDRSGCCQRLLDIALEAGAPDNVTVVLAET